MDISQFIDAIESDATRLSSTARDTGLEAAVPSCPGWAIRDLVTHLGGVHRWATAIVAGGLPASDDVTYDLVGIGPTDESLLDWYSDGHRALVETLRAAPADLACYTFLPAPTPLAFWARRQAHETAIHRADGETAHGTVTPYDASFAIDGIGEIVLGFAPRRKTAMPPASMGINLTDAEDTWFVTFGPSGVTTTTGMPRQSNPHVSVSGSASDIYLWLWNRPADASVIGDTAAAELWQQRVKVTWS